MIVLDTNVISELMRPKPNMDIVHWLDRQPRTSIWITSISVFELRFGLQVMPIGRRQAALMSWFEQWLSEVVQQRIANYDEFAARLASDLAVDRQKRGRSGELRDTMIAGIVLASRATLATRNVKHFEEIAPHVVNPWAT